MAPPCDLGGGMRTLQGDAGMWVQDCLNCSLSSIQLLRGILLSSAGDWSEERLLEVDGVAMLLRRELGLDGTGATLERRDDDFSAGGGFAPPEQMVRIQ